MLRKTLVSFAAIIALASTTNAMAAASNYSAAAKPSLYANFNIGYAYQTGKGSLAFDALTLDKRTEHKFGWNAYMGYNFNLKANSGIAIEGGYADYGSMEWRNEGSDGVDIDQTAFIAQLVYNYGWKRNLDLFAKAGLALGRTNINTDGTAMTTNSTLSTSGTMSNQKLWNIVPMATLGFTYNFMEELGVNFMWEHIFGEKFKSSNIDEFQAVDAFMLGLIYRFDF